VSTVGATSAADAARDARRPQPQYGRIIVVGGGCYGGYYVRQLLRAHRAGALAWDELLVVDRDSSCAVSSLDVDDRPPRLRLVASEWEAFFAQYLSSAAQDDHRSTDAIVPSPLMPHLMADWLLARARARWPERAVGIGSIETLPSIPWQRSGDDGTRYVSFAEWICPINCIEPARCPETRGPRSWSLPAALAAASNLGAGAPSRLPLLFHCTHRAYGVGMIDVRDVVAADATIGERGSAGEAAFLVGTVSHCHGALRCITIGPESRERPGSIADFSR
jgi:hypothetical protein